MVPQACKSAGVPARLPLCPAPSPSCQQVAWAVVGSHNHSMAAFGKLEKGGKQLYVKAFGALRA